MTFHPGPVPHPCTHLRIHGAEVGKGSSMGTGILVGRIAVGIKAAFCTAYGKLFVCLSLSCQLSAWRPVTQSSLGLALRRSWVCAG